MKQSELPNGNFSDGFAVGGTAHSLLHRKAGADEGGDGSTGQPQQQARPTQRAAQLHVRETDESTNTVRVSVASSRPLLRCGYWQPWLEQIELENADLSWLKSGNAPLLFGHSQNSQIGLIENPALEPDGEYYDLVVDLRFFPDVPESMAAWEKVKAGFTRNVSIGWTRGTGDVDEIAPGKDNNLEYNLVVYREAQIIEVSLVAIPADHTVGIGREVSEDCIASCRSAINHAREDDMTQKSKPKAGDGGKPDAEQLELERNGGKPPAPDKPEPDEGKRKQEPPAKPEPAKPEPDAPVQFDDTGQRWLSANETRLRSIGVADGDITKLRKLVDDEKDKDGISENTVQSEAWKMIDKTDEERSGIGIGSPAIQTGDGHSFDVAKVVRSLSNNKPIEGIEAEVIDQFSKDTERWQPARSGASVFIPHSALMCDPQVRNFVMSSLASASRVDPRYQAPYEMAKRVYEVGSTPTGFFHEAFDENIFAPALIAQATLLAKCTVLPTELVQDLATIREGADITTYWSTEKSTRAESTTLPTFTNRTFQWHQINARAGLFQRTIDQSRAFVGRLIEAMRRDIPRGIDVAMINGASASNQPVGILNYSGLDTPAIGTNGGRPEWDDITALIGQVESNNAMNKDGWCFGMNAGIKGRLYSQGRYGATSSTTGRDFPIIDTMGMMEMIQGYPVITDNNMPTNLVKGSSSDCTPIIFGDFSSIEVAPFSGVELVVDPWNGIATSQVDIYMRQALDILPKQVDCVAAIVDARNV